MVISCSFVGNKASKHYIERISLVVTAYGKRFPNISHVDPMES